MPDDLSAGIARIAATALLAARERDGSGDHKAGPTKSEAIGALNLLDMAKHWIGEKYLLPEPDSGQRMQ